MQKFSNQWLGHWVLLIWAITNIYTHWNSWSFDASALYFSAYFYDLGQFGLVYSPEPKFFWGDNPPAEWIAVAKAQGDVIGDMSPYVYPPLWAALLAPVASDLTALQFFNLFYVINTAAIVGSVYLAYGFLRPQRLAFSYWCIITVLMIMFSSIGQLALDLNQPQILVTFLILAAFRSLLFGRDGIAGAMLAIAAAIKVAPGLLAIIFIMERRWTALAVFSVVGLALLGSSFLIAGPELHYALVTRLQDLNSQVLVSRIAVTLDAILVQTSNWLSASPGWEFTHYWIQTEPEWVSWIIKLLLLTGLVAVYFLTHKLQLDLRLWFRLQLVFLITLITGPLAWIHYLILPLLLLPGIIGMVPHRISVAILVLFTTVFSSILYVVLYVQIWGGNAQIYLTFSMTVALIGFLAIMASRQSGNTKNIT